MPKQYSLKNGGIMKYLLINILTLLCAGLMAQNVSTQHQMIPYNSTDVPGEIIIDQDTMYSYTFGLEYRINDQQQLESTDIVQVYKMDLNTRTVLDSIHLRNTKTRVGIDLYPPSPYYNIINGFSRFGDDFILFSEHPDSFKGIQIHVLNKDLEIIQSKVITIEEMQFFPQSVAQIGECFYIGGHNSFTGRNHEIILKVSKHLELLDVWDYYHPAIEDHSSRLFHLQKNHSNNLVYITEYFASRQSGYSNGLNIVEIDTLGNVLLDTVLVSNSSITIPNLHVDIEGNYIVNDRFIYPRHEFYNIDAKTHQPNWYLLPSVFVPRTGVWLGHRLAFFDYANCANGDILATGELRDGKSGIALSGFVIRITNDGELVFFKKIALPTDLDVVKSPDFYSYKFAPLQRVQELSNGDILLLGTAGSYSDTLEYGVVHYDLWVLTLDAHGCYNHDCGRKEGVTDILIIDSKGKLTSPNWGIGTKWYYEYVNTFPPEVTYMTYEITDTTTFKGESVFVLSTPEGDTYLKQSDGRVWIYIEEMDDYQLTYDFKLTDQTTFLWDAMCPDSLDGASTHVATMRVDTILPFVLPDGTGSQIQHISYQETTPVDSYGDFARQAIANVGFDYGGLGLGTGYLICTNVLSEYTKLRCFESDGIEYNFVGYPCDSTWLKVNTVEEELPAFSVFPNPTHSELRISTDHNGSISYQIRSIDGKLVTQGITNTKSIQVDHLSGVYILRLFINDQWHNTKVLVE